MGERGLMTDPRLVTVTAPSDTHSSLCFGNLYSASTAHPRSLPRGKSQTPLLFCLTLSSKIHHRAPAAGPQTREWTDRGWPSSSEVQGDSEGQTHDKQADVGQGSKSKW